MDISNLPFSQASEKNKRPILSVLGDRLGAGGRVLEIGSGTGQHAVYFASELPLLIWQPTDQPENLPAVAARVAAARLDNMRKPLTLEVSTADWSSFETDHVYSANTAHIMDEAAVIAMFLGVGRLLTDGEFILYGPFNRNGAFTSDSNRAFDSSLRRSNSGMGIRDDRWLEALAGKNGMILRDDIEMPANNRILVWCKA